MKRHFSDIPASFDFIANERELLEWWYKSGVVKQYLHKNDPPAGGQKKRFSFIDGPITANNPMGVHHAWGRTLKDLYQRYKNMQGYAQRFQNGFDCQGLWVEVEVEKEKGFKNKKDIENYGIAQFVQDCKDRVIKYSKIQTDQTKRLGNFMDWDNSFYTMDDQNNYMIWHFLKKCFEEGNLYKGEDVVPWCPRCGTAITQHEIDSEGYKQITHDTLYMRFPVVKNGKLQKNEFLMVWTTTPWTVPADTIIAVSPDIDYALVEYENNKYWLAKNLVEKTFKKPLIPIKIINGKQLIKDEKISHYKAPFDHLPIIRQISSNSPQRFHALVLSKELVNDLEGTGVVHIVPGTGTEDYYLVKRDLCWDDVIFAAVDESGNYLKGYGELTGKNAKNNPNLIIEHLKKYENGHYLFEVRPYEHSYPTCWRCKSELIWRVVDEWYVRMDNPRKPDKKTLRQRMVDIAKKISWVPNWGMERELDWLKNMHDWLISKKRYWGLALPIWECECGNIDVIGSKEELQQKSVSGWDKFNGHTPHKPWIDEIKLKCPKCAKLMTRVPDVGTPWLDAGIVNFSTLYDPETKKLSYTSDKKFFKKWYPADFVTENFTGQFRNWFYAMIAMSTALEDTEPFRNLLGYALVRDEKGEEMHKSKGNAIWFDDAAEKMGVDTMRWMYCRQNPELNLNFGYKIADEVRRQFIFLYWNTYKFFITYANLNEWSPATDHLRSEFVLDQWILSRLESTKKIATEKLDNYLHQEALLAIENFLNDLSLWYIRRSRERINPANENTKDRNACLATLYKVLKDLSLLLAPFTPYLTETVWQGLYPHHLGGEKENAKNSIHLQNWPEINEKLINPELEEIMKTARDEVSIIHGIRKTERINVRQPLSTMGTANLQDFESFGVTGVIKDEVNVKTIITASGVTLDTKNIPDDLKREGEARELIRQIQIMRKETGLSPTDKIKTFAPSWPKEWEEKIKNVSGTISLQEAEELRIEKV